MKPMPNNLNPTGIRFNLLTENQDVIPHTQRAGWPELLGACEKLVAKYPQWTFVLVNSTSYGYTQGVQVYGQEKHLLATFFYCDDMYQLTSKRTRAEQGNSRRKSHIKKTRNLSVFLKTFNLYAEETTDADYVAAASKLLAPRSPRTSHSVAYSIFNALQSRSASELLPHWPSIASMLQQIGETPAAISSMHGWLEETDIVLSVEAPKQGRPYLMTRVREGYLVAPMSSVVANRFDDHAFVHDSQLADEVRTKIGILKLVEKSTYVRDVGFSNTPNTYLVVNANGFLKTP